MSDESQDTPKIIVDDDWKTQVEAEKEALQKAYEEKKESTESQMPPASFPMLVTTLATQAMASLGQIPDPVEGKPVIRKEIAKHMIDTLGVLEEKTKGNLSTEESAMLNDVLHQLRMAYVAVPDQAEPEEPSQESKIELP